MPNLYDIYFNGIHQDAVAVAPDLPDGVRFDPFRHRGPVVSNHENFKRVLKEKDDAYLFIITKEQEHAWNKWVEKLGLAEYIVFSMPNYVTNPNYVARGRRLKAFLIQGKGKSE